MKAPTFLFALFFALATFHAAEVPLPEFNSNSIEHPSLSLSELGKGEVKPMPFGYKVPSVNDLQRDGLLGDRGRPASAWVVPTPPRFAQKSAPGRMPVLEPNPNIDYKIVLKEPDPTLDPKMLIAPRDSQTNTAPAR